MRKKNIYLGIEILRIILSFLIVVYHIHSRFIKSYIFDFALYYVDLYTSSFFLISFYFSVKTLSSKKISLAKERIKRIIIPYIIWPIIIFFKSNIYNFIKYHKYKYLLRDIYVQLVVGRKINDVFWFQFNLIFITIYFLIIVFMFPKKFPFFLALNMVIAIVFNYNKYDIKIFSKYRISIYHSIGRVSFSIIYSITGLFLGSMNLLEKLKIINKFKKLVFFPIFLFFLKEHKKLITIIPKFHFLILDLSIVILFILFGSFPLCLLKNDKNILLIKRITSLTGGVYYMHLFIYDCLGQFSKIIKNQDIKSCLIIYIICSLFSIIFSNLFRKSNLKFIFI